MCVCTEGTGCQGLKVQRRPASVASCMCGLGQVHFRPLSLFSSSLKWDPPVLRGLMCSLEERVQGVGLSVVGEAGKASDW